MAQSMKTIAPSARVIAVCHFTGYGIWTHEGHAVTDEESEACNEFICGLWGKNQVCDKCERKTVFKFRLGLGHPSIGLSINQEAELGTRA